MAATFPETVLFEGLGRCFYDLVERRPPRAGEYYLSGAVVEAWRAIGDMRAEYYVVKPTYRAVQTFGWARGDRL